MLAAASIKSCSYSAAVANTVSPNSWMPLTCVIFSGFVPYVRDEPRLSRYNLVNAMPFMSPVMTDEPRLKRHRDVSFIPVILPVIIDEPRVLRYRVVTSLR